MKLELGKTYRTRGGDVYKIDYVDTTPGAVWPFKSHDNTANRPRIGWVEDGSFIRSGQDHEDDLIEEVTVSTNLTLEPGKYYRTRDGRKAYVAGISPFDVMDSYQVTGWIEGVTVARAWYLDGGHVMSCYESEADIISEWREPVKVAGWANIYTSSTASQALVVHPSRELADQNATSERITCIYVSGEEGVGP